MLNKRTFGNIKQITQTYSDIMKVNELQHNWNNNTYRQLSKHFKKTIDRINIRTEKKIAYTDLEESLKLLVKKVEKLNTKIKPKHWQYIERSITKQRKKLRINDLQMYLSEFKIHFVKTSTKNSGTKRTKRKTVHNDAELGNLQITRKDYLLPEETEDEITYTNTQTDNNIPNNTLNLSKVALSQEQIFILNLGVKFVPTKLKYKKEEIMRVITEMKRKIKLKDFFNDSKEKFVQTPFRLKSTWTPEIYQLSAPTLDTLTEINTEYDKILNKFAVNNNNFFCSGDTNNLQNRKPLSLLKQNRNIVIRKADKGNIFVILNKTDYDREVYRQLSDVKYYRKINEPIHTVNKNFLNRRLQRAYTNKEIDLKTFQYLQINNYKTRKFYILPKIHKTRDKWPTDSQPPGRPIVADINTESSRIAQFIDFYINKYSTRLKSYIRDSFDLANKIKDMDINNNDMLITGDVTALYTNMDINRTIAVTKQTLNKYPEGQRPDNLIIDLLKYTLKHNDFVYEKDSFLQICGCAMGKKYSPSLANLYLENLDNYIINYKHKPITYYRYLDDIFLIWKGDNITDIEEFNTNINKVTPGIQIELHYNKEQVDFLDMTIFKKNQTKIGTKVYFKETNNRIYLNPKSAHPMHTFKSIIKSQLIRYKRLCSDEHDFIQTSIETIRIQANQGYNRRSMYKILREVININTNKQDSNNVDKPDIFPIIIPYSRIGREMATTLKNILRKNKNFKTSRFINAYTVGNNLQRTLFNKQNNLDNNLDHNPNPNPNPINPNPTLSIDPNSSPNLTNYT